MKKNAGFTLIELVAVMVILAILAVVAVPQFVDLRTEARAAAAQGVAGSLSSGSALNFALRSVRTGSGVAVNDCDDVPATLQGAALPTGYTVTSAPIVPPASATCTLNGPDGSTANYTAIGIN